MKQKISKEQERNRDNIRQGWKQLAHHPLFRYVNLPGFVYAGRSVLGRNGYGKVKTSKGSEYFASDDLVLNDSISMRPEEWTFVIAHLYMHLAFGHFDAEKMPGYDAKTNTAPKIYEQTWNVACDIYIDKFLRELKIGKPVGEDPMQYIPGNTANDEQTIYRYLLNNNIVYGYEKFGMLGDQADMEGLGSPLIYDKSLNNYWSRPYNCYSKNFARALAHSLSESVSIAGGHGKLSDKKESSITKAATWFLGHYPLLGGLASAFRIEQDPEKCRQNEISIAAIDIDEGIIYANSAKGYNEDEWRFILAHEYLHAGLQHNTRQDGRDPYLWNIACDYVINGWLKEMHIGTMPPVGLMFDEALKGRSAEDIYDLMMKDMRRYSKQLTFRGYSKGDIIGNGSKSYANGVSLDEFCRNALMQGLEYHINQKRGFIPAGLIEEIRALAMPPIAWDVKLANWFDQYIIPAEKHRSYAHPSRRQGSTPDIPRPRYVISDEEDKACTYGVVIDTSGSMGTKDLGKALGSVASYSVAKGVSAVRVVYCDADAYDAGYMTPEEIAGRVEVTGRGGTKLQSAVDLLEAAGDFPKDGPILLITDGFIEDRMMIKRTHAFLIPKGNRLPFKPKGEIFYYE